MFDVCNQVLGNTSSVYWWLADSDKQSLINGINANKAVTYATNGNPGDGLYGPHAYTVLGYDSLTDTFQLYNPWGTNHPGPLTYAQLRADGQCFVVADTSGTTPPSSGDSGDVAASPVGPVIPCLVPLLDTDASQALGPGRKAMPTQAASGHKLVPIDSALVAIPARPRNQAIAEPRSPIEHRFGSRHQVRCRPVCAGLPEPVGRERCG